ncbi:FHA domain-containing protein [Arthroderma uncinatum]|uniref:FHA domain-containing protein n=1 Tax=Arthroderma uncinatum TaxID=74035 RepID=UPI00144A6278|nr:FHA domain-containing protein [Arthroderma uncinatum]KAF3483401.1 FHA domain-containing protein [Arthroderma uncinatum]
MTTAAPSCPTTAPPSFGSRLRRLSQRRPPTHSNTSSSSAPSSHRSYRKRLSWVVGRASHTPAAPEDHHHHHHDHHHAESSLQQQENSDLLHAELARSPSAELESSSQRYSVFSRSDAESSESSTSEDRPEQQQQSIPSGRLPAREMMAQALNMTPAAESGQQQDSSSSSPPETSRGSERPPTNENYGPTSRAGNAPAPAAAETSEISETSTSQANSTGQQQSTIRFFAYQDPHQNSRPSLPFTPMTRTITDEASIIKVGRYSERDGVPPENTLGPSAAPVGFKSKVVSRKHCEFSFIGGQWHIKDVGSSSGTFLNHMRLSQPNVPSRQYAVRDGDIVQLGIDFRGGEELIFRCVRIRIECNRMWQQRANEFNKNTEALINNLGKGSTDATDYEGCRECSICLGSVLRPYQCLFMAACAHVWHYKCIRRLIHSPEYPMFQCPNCRAYTDLNAEVDDSNDSYEENIKPTANAQRQTPSHFPPQAIENTASNSSRANNNSSTTPPIVYTHTETDGTLAAATGNMTLESDPEPEPEPDLEPPERVDRELYHPAMQDPSESAMANDVQRSPNIDILSPSSTLRAGTGRRRVPDSSNRDTIFVEDPLTPRNDTGLLALDGRAGRL